MGTTNALVTTIKIMVLSMSKMTSMARVEVEKSFERLIWLRNKYKGFFIWKLKREIELKNESGGVLVKSTNEKNGREKNSNGLYLVPFGVVAGIINIKEAIIGLENTFENCCVFILLGVMGYSELLRLIFVVWWGNLPCKSYRDDLELEWTVVIMVLDMLR